jgi:hypothetical protein
MVVALNLQLQHQHQFILQMKSRRTQQRSQSVLVSYGNKVTVGNAYSMYTGNSVSDAGLAVVFDLQLQALTRTYSTQ